MLGRHRQRHVPAKKVPLLNPQGECPCLLYIFQNLPIWGTGSCRQRLVTSSQSQVCNFLSCSQRLIISVTVKQKNNEMTVLPGWPGECKQARLKGQQEAGRCHQAAARPMLAVQERLWALQTSGFTLWLMICHVLGRRSL